MPMANTSGGLAMPTSKVEIRPTFKAKPGQYDKALKFCQDRFVRKMVQLQGVWV